MNGDPTAEPGGTGWPDLASRSLGGSVVAANDELFAPRESLIYPEAPTFDPSSFGPKGKVYDGWETRRRREAGNDFAVLRLGASGVVHAVTVDTSWFTGNYPPYISVEGACLDDYPSVAELLATTWHPLVAKSPAYGDCANEYAVTDSRRWTHVRLSIYPDGGVARFRVHGEALPDPKFLSGTVDLVAAENGGRVVGCSNAHYSAPMNLLMPGRARHMGEGWENARRRGDGNDYAVFRLGVPGALRYAEIDTSYFVGNAPGEVQLSAVGESGGSRHDLLPRTRVQPDTRHRFVIADDGVVDEVRLDVYPDGGLSRLRLWGEADPSALDVARSRWDSGS